MRTVTRPAKIDDLDALCRIELECFEDEAITKAQLAYFLRSPRFTSLAAEANSHIAGFIIGSVERHGNSIFGHIYSLDVSQRYRRRGVASSLLEEAEKVFADSGAQSCILEVRTDNVAALELYRKHGYRIVEILTDYYGTAVNGFRLEKRLLHQ